MTYRYKEATMTTKATAIRIPTELANRYSKLAKATGRTKSYYLNEALAESIDRLEYEYGLMKDVED